MFSLQDLFYFERSCLVLMILWNILQQNNLWDMYVCQRYLYTWRSVETQKRHERLQRPHVVSTQWMCITARTKGVCHTHVSIYSILWLILTFNDICNVDYIVDVFIIHRFAQVTLQNIFLTQWYHIYLFLLVTFWCSATRKRIYTHKGTDKSGNTHLRFCSIKWCFENDPKKMCIWKRICQIHQIRWIKYKYKHKYVVWNLIKYKYIYKYAVFAFVVST